MHVSQILSRIFILFIVITPRTFADDRVSQTKHGETFQNNIVIEHNNEQLNMSLTGLTTRKKFFLNIYSMAHYIEQKPNAAVESNSITNNTPEEIYSSILHDKTSKQISMIFLRSLKAKQVQKSLRASIKSNTTDEVYSQILPQVEAFMRAIYSDVKKNDEFVIRWFPDGNVVALYAGQQISSIESEQLGRALWLIWFGEDSVIDRKSLIYKLLTSS